MSRKFEKTAVSRNKKKRQVYEAIRNNIKEKPNDEAENRYYDIILIPYKKILTCNYSKIYQNISDILMHFKKIS